MKMLGPTGLLSNTQKANYARRNSKRGSAARKIAIHAGCFCLVILIFIKFGHLPLSLSLIVIVTFPIVQSCL